jgi:ribonuclease P protein component
MSTARLQKCARLLKATDFKQVFDNPERSSDRYFTVLARLNGKDYPRLGLAISKKNAKLAVSRNRIKRIIRESFRQTTNLCNADFVVMTTRQGEQGTNQELFAALQKHWQTIQKKCAQS